MSGVGVEVEVKVKVRTEWRMARCLGGAGGGEGVNWGEGVSWGGGVGAAGVEARERMGQRRVKCLGGKEEA